MRKKLVLGVVAGLGLFAAFATGDPGGYSPPRAGSATQISSMGGPGTLIGAGDLPPGRGPDCYGWSPCIKKLFRIGVPSERASRKNPLKNPANWSAGGYGVGGPAYNPQGFPPGAYGPNGPMMQGTLVFPHHPFVRSPRDYFMVDVNK